MAEYISRAALMGELTSSDMQQKIKAMTGAEAYTAFLLMVGGAEKADVAEVRHGEWIDVGGLSCRCSECGCKNNRESKWCPNCGAQMDGGADHVSHSQDDYDAFISGTQPQREDV